MVAVIPRDMLLYNGNQSPEDKTRVNSRNFVYIKYTSDNVQCPIKYSYNKPTTVTTFREQVLKTCKERTFTTPK